MVTVTTEETLRALLYVFLHRIAKHYIAFIGLDNHVCIFVE